MPKFLRQKGFIPIILVIVLTVVVAGVAGVVYNSKKEIKIKSDKTSETVEVKGTPAPGSENADVAADQIGKLSDKSFENKVDNKIASSPNFSITPPAGWEKLPPSGNTVVEFLSPSKDKIKEGIATFSVQPNITVYVEKGNYKDLDEVARALNEEGDALGYQISSSQRTQINGEEVYVKESTIDLADLAKEALEAQVKQEIAKSGTKISEDVIQKDMNKVLAQAKGRTISYIYYKNGYFINVTGKALESSWSTRGGQLKQSMDTFKLE